MPAKLSNFVARLEKRTPAPLWRFLTTWQLVATANYIMPVVAGCAGMFMFGLDIGSMGVFQGSPAFHKVFGTYDAELGENRLLAGRAAGISATYPGGALLASLLIGWISDGLGRRMSLMVSCMCWFLGVIIQTSAQNLVALIIGRLIYGFAVGIITNQAPMYVAEVSPKRIRGRCIILVSCANNFGSLGWYYLSYGCTKIDGTSSFRLAWGLMLVPCAIATTMLLFSPESPRWLAQKDRWDEAIDLIVKIQGKGDAENKDVVEEVTELKAVISGQRMDVGNLTKLKRMFSNKVSRRKVLTGTTIHIGQQMTGINAVTYYVNNIFNMAGYTGSEATLMSGVIYVLTTAAGMIPVFIADRVGRRAILIFGAASLAGWQWCIGSLFAVYSVPTGPKGLNGNDQVRMMIPEENKTVSRALIASVYLFCAFFSATWSAVPWSYSAEIFNQEERAVGNGISTACNWAMNFIITMTAPIGYVKITYRTYFIYAAYMTFGAFFAFFCYPETSQKSLEEVELMWHANIPAWKSGKWRPSPKELEIIAEENNVDLGKVTGQHFNSIDLDSEPTSLEPSTCTSFVEKPSERT